jgi:hypothetical protein
MDVIAKISDDDKFFGMMMSQGKNILISRVLDLNNKIFEIDNMEDLIMNFEDGEDSNPDFM